MLDIDLGEKGSKGGMFLFVSLVKIFVLRTISTCTFVYSEFRKSMQDEKLGETAE